MRRRRRKHLGEIVKFKLPKLKKGERRSFNGWLRPEPPEQPFHAPTEPIEWTREALSAYRAAYSSVRQYPGNRNYFLPICKGLDAALVAQAIGPCPTWTGTETGALDRAQQEHLKAAGAGPWCAAGPTADAALSAGLNAAIANLDKRVTPFISRKELRTKQRARRIREVEQEIINWRRLREMKAALERSRRNCPKPAVKSHPF